MYLNIDQQYRMEALFLLASENTNLLNRFEKRFVEDNRKRYVEDDGGPNSEDGYFVSFKMWRIFASIEQRLML